MRDRLGLTKLLVMLSVWRMGHGNSLTFILTTCVSRGHSRKGDEALLALLIR